jgi:hypothetical protein
VFLATSHWQQQLIFSIPFSVTIVHAVSSLTNWTSPRAHWLTHSCVSLGFDSSDIASARTA